MALWHHQYWSYWDVFRPQICQMFNLNLEIGLIVQKSQPHGIARCVTFLQYHPFVSHTRSILTYLIPYLSMITIKSQRKPDFLPPDWHNHQWLLKINKCKIERITKAAQPDWRPKPLVLWLWHHWQQPTTLLLLIHITNKQSLCCFNPFVKILPAHHLSWSTSHQNSAVVTAIAVKATVTQKSSH